MRKHLIALAAGSIAALVGSAAHAQSNVTIYGIVDSSVEYINKVGATGDSLTRLFGLPMTVTERHGWYQADIHP